MSAVAIIVLPEPVGLESTTVSRLPSATAARAWRTFLYRLATASSWKSLSWTFTRGSPRC